MVIVSPIPPEVGENDFITGGAKQVKPLKLSDPPIVFTFILPLEPVPTTAIMVLLFRTLKDFAVSFPNLTDCVPAKANPLMVSIPPVGADFGEKEVIVGGVKQYLKPDKVDVPPPPPVVTDTYPLVPAPTIAIIVLSFKTV